MVDEGDTWTHFFFHFLTGPLNTAVEPYRAEARPTLVEPTPSIFDDSSFSKKPDQRKKKGEFLSYDSESVKLVLVQFEMLLCLVFFL